MPCKATFTATVSAPTRLDRALRDQYPEWGRKEVQRAIGSGKVRLNGRVDALAATLRPVIAEWSTNRLAKFDRAVSSEVFPGSRDTENPMDPNRPVWQLKRFIAGRAASVRDQLEGRSDGVVLSRQPPRR